MCPLKLQGHRSSSSITESLENGLIVTIIKYRVYLSRYEGVRKVFPEEVTHQFSPEGPTRDSWVMEDEAEGRRWSGL